MIAQADSQSMFDAVQSAICASSVRFSRGLRSLCHLLTQPCLQKIAAHAQAVAAQASSGNAGLIDGSHWLALRLTTRNDSYD